MSRWRRDRRARFSSGNPTRLEEMNHHTVRPRLGPTALAALLACLTALGALAQGASAVAVLNTDVAEEWANEYGEAHCASDGAYSTWGLGGRCRQQGKFQVTCFAIADYENGASEEFWQCQRRVRYTVERRAWHRRKKLVSHRRFLGPWTCEPHHTQPRY